MGPQNAPGDTHFALAVTENSHNHVGARRLFLDFQDAPGIAGDPSLGVVVSAPVAPGAITVDGDLSDWDTSLFTDISGLVQNNYPLSEYVDAVRTQITVGSAWDAEYVYLVVHWRDAGLDASTRFRKWMHDAGGDWEPQESVGPTPGGANEAAANATGHPLAGGENEDRVLVMWPIVDTEGNFLPDGPGCAMYCHAALSHDNAFQDQTGAGVSVMSTNTPGDTADIWQWQSSRTNPSGHADDMELGHADHEESGLTTDAGTTAYMANELENGHPLSMHLSGLGFLGDVLMEAMAVPFAGAPSAGAEIPSTVSVQPTGSRADVEAAGLFGPSTGTWTVEFRRLRDTGFGDDHSFNGLPAPPPTTPLVSAVVPAAGEALFNQTCVLCHGPEGLGNADEYGWIFPRIQRASGSLILKSLATVPDMEAIDLTDQEIEDIAAWLQTKAIWGPVQAYGEACHDLLARWDNEPALGSSDFKLLLLDAPPGAPALLMVGISNAAWGAVPLPLDLGAFGAPGCSLQASVEVLMATLVDPFGEARFVVAVPNDPALSGTRAYVQWAAAAGPDPLGFGFTEGLEVTIP